MEEKLDKDNFYKQVSEFLSSKYPNVFCKEKVILLKKGIHEDIARDAQNKFSKTTIRKFLKGYVSKKAYRDLHKEGASRYDLEGKEVDKVTKEEAESIKRIVESRKKKARPKAAKINSQKPKLGLKL